MKPFSTLLIWYAEKYGYVMEEDFLNFYTLIFFTAAISTTTLNRQVRNLQVKTWRFFFITDKNRTIDILNSVSNQ
ncbi:hypothetical protein DN586_21000 [Enterobacter cloacae]|nr:hypothetical protein DN586_21000 [Enterobacter cloacae]